MTNTPKDLLYTESHEWIRFDENSMIATVGITDYAQKSLGDIVYIDSPATNKEFESKTDVAVIESVKSASDIYCPISGTIEEVNDILNTTPEIINTDPYGDGWIFKVKLKDGKSIADFNLLSSSDYEKLIA